MSEENKDLDKAHKPQAKAAKTTAKKVNTTATKDDVESGLNLRDLNPKAQDGRFPTQPAQGEGKKHNLGPNVLVRTARGGEMYDPRSDSWIGERATQVPMSNWLQAQIDAKKIIQEK